MEFRPGQVVTVFRSRLRPGSTADYTEEAERIESVVAGFPGLVDYKGFEAADGERVTIVTFADEASHDAWRRHSDHRRAQRRGREEFYTWYSVQVCRAVRVAGFGTGECGGGSACGPGDT